VVGCWFDLICVDGAALLSVLYSEMTAIFYVGLEGGVCVLWLEQNLRIDIGRTPRAWSSSIDMAWRDLARSGTIWHDLLDRESY